MSDDKLRKIINSSGFPFQIAIENAIKNLRGWEIVRREYSWRNKETGQDGYIDLIVKNEYGICLIIECKRVRDSEWVFLCSPKNLNRSHARVWVNSVFGDTDKLGWHDEQVNPTSPEADFCAILGQDHKKPLLENIACELVTATEAFASDEYSFRISASYIPVIVTTAKLYICEFDVNDIQLETGDITNPKFRSVPFVRFRKSLTTQVSKFAIEKPPKNIIESATAKERTVFIVNALTINDLLVGLEYQH